MTPTATGLTRLVGPTDADLLTRFVAARDDAAFAELVRRHGPAVLAVCRRLTGHLQDAEDAFQAAFLVLARKADRVHPGEPVAGWLVGVAVRAARNAAARAWRRRGREALVEVVPDVSARGAEPFDPDAAAAVLDEVGRLPAFLRSAVILCELEGRSRFAAARELGVAEGTLSSRLAAARKRLAARLAARGFAPAVLAVLAPAVVPRRLQAATADLTTTPVPGSVSTLARGVLPIMDVRRLSLVPLLAGLAAVAALAIPGASAPPPPTAPAPRAAAAPAAAAGPNKLFFCHGDDFYLCDPDGRNGRVVSHPECPDPHPDAFSLSPDGKTVVYAMNKGNPGARVQRLLLFAADGTGPATDIGDGRATMGYRWSGDGTRIAVMSGDDEAKDAATANIRHEVVDVATGRRTRLPVPRDHYVTDWSRDGERFVTCQIGVLTDGRETCRTWLLDRHGKTVREIGAPEKLMAAGGRLSPDGRRVLCSALRPDDDRDTGLLYVFDLATGSTTPVVGVPPGGHLGGCCWSPDGRRIAYTWQSNRVEPKPGHLDPNQKIELRAIVCDPDGRNATVVASDRSTAGNWSFGSIDWR
ncbi:sigma-70 family RNA polymerase sigma factor [Urbifossiella limnaea]|uniref:ECF RNA polymerase sigma factor SigE n=1 Tax=Urbifossiella limnaea TaxID=2528023 RepID=A0A517Y0Y1_9BACT|nr:sigma-70 family RNA polymerase sigma factor [Urbifossiella limnaea]QDU23411.1 ECF RNA polymerase sigma factor SigE [Urbifossiella limnaea]